MQGFAPAVIALQVFAGDEIQQLLQIGRATFAQIVPQAMTVLQRHGRRLEQSGVRGIIARHQNELTGIFNTGLSGLVDKPLKGITPVIFTAEQRHQHYACLL